MCNHHTHFCGTCSACQREQLARWRRQLADATTLARGRGIGHCSTATARTYSATATPVGSR
jgi:hypothetical protein